MHKANKRQPKYKNNLLKFLLLFCFYLSLNPIKSQTLSQSPYSFYGIGDEQYLGSFAFAGMGQVSQGLRRRYDLNILNPASYSALAQTNIEAGAFLGNGKLQSNKTEKEVSLSGLSYFNIGTSISKKGIGIAFGAAPFTSIGYNIATLTPLNFSKDSVFFANTSQQGEGGINKAFAGIGVKLHKNFSAGANFSYVFGSIDSRILQTIDDTFNFFNWDVNQKSYVSGLLIDYGFQSHFDSLFIGIPQYKTVVDSNGFERKKLILNKKNPISFNAGVSFNLETNLTGTQRYVFRTLSRGGVDFAKDSIKNFDDVNGNITMPFSIKYGIAFTNNQNWTLAADFGTTAWSRYSEYGQNQSLQDAWHFNVGASWLPDMKEDMRNYFKRLEYRIGYRTEQTNIMIDKQSVNLVGYSCGIGIPIAERGPKRFSKINLGFEYLTRGANTTGIISEEYYNIRIGIVFTDKWFIKYKYD